MKQVKRKSIIVVAVRIIFAGCIRLPETETLAGYLRDVVIYQKDDSYTEYAGQGVIYTLTMTDGTQTTVMAYNPFLVIDGVGYRTKYQPCEALNGYANRLLQ